MTNQRRQRGTGRIFQKRGCARFTIQYYRNGVLIREATGSTDRKVAEQKLRQRLAQIATGTFVGPHVERVTVAELYQPYLDDLKRRGKGIDATERRWRLHLQAYFGWRRAATVGTDALNGYVNQRVEEKAAPASINRDMAALRGMLRVAYFSDPPKLTRLPKFPHCDESENVRKGFVELDQYRKMQALAEPLWLRAMLEIFWTYGWRKEEVLSMRVRQVDFVANVIRLDVGTTKNKEGREVPMRASVRDLLVKCAQDKQPDDRLFTREDGKPVKCFRKAWKSLCEAAGVPHLMVHDMRRTAARNLRRAGVTEGIIMSIGGWKTRSVFDRYNITDQRDRIEALKKLEEAQNRAKVEPHQSNDAQKNDSGKQKRLN